jgi:hypothetical protein
MPYNVKEAAVQAVIEEWKNMDFLTDKLKKALNDLVIAWEEKE